MRAELLAFARLAELRRTLSTKGRCEPVMKAEGLFEVAAEP